jgi:hypothetical protein
VSAVIGVPSGVGVGARNLGLAREDRSYAGGEDTCLGVGRVTQAPEGRPLARRGSTREKLAIKTSSERKPALAVDAKKFALFGRRDQSLVDPFVRGDRQEFLEVL